MLAGGAFISLAVFTSEHGFSLPLLFNVHVWCMLLGVGAVLPIVTGSLLSSNSAPNDKRSAHGRVAYFALLCIGIGMVGIFLHKASLGKPLLSFSLHASCGWLLLAAFTVQGLSGHRKLREMQASGVRLHRWHGISGAVLSFAAYIVLALGLVRVLSSGPALALALLGCAVPAVGHAAVFIPRMYARTQLNVYASVPATEEAPPSSAA